MKIIKDNELVEKVIDNNFKSDSGGGMEMLNMNRIPGWYKRKQHIRSNMMFHPFIQKLCMKTEFPFMRPCNLTPDCSIKGKNNNNKKKPTTNNKPHTQQLSRLIWSLDTQTVAFFPSGPHSLYHYSPYSKAKNPVTSYVYGAMSMSFNSQTSPRAHLQLLYSPTTRATATVQYMKFPKQLQWYSLRENT